MDNILSNWTRWMWKRKRFLPWQAGLISHRELTEEEYNLPSKINLDDVLKEDGFTKEDMMKISLTKLQENENHG